MHDVVFARHHYLCICARLWTRANHSFAIYARSVLSIQIFICGTNTGQNILWVPGSSSGLAGVWVGPGPRKKGICEGCAWLFLLLLLASFIMSCRRMIGRIYLSFVIFVPFKYLCRPETKNKKHLCYLCTERARGQIWVLDLCIPPIWRNAQIICICALT